MKNFLLAILFLLPLTSFNEKTRNKIVLSKAELYDKIKGGWAGQFIGVTYGADAAPSASLQDTRVENVVWPDGYQLSTYATTPGIYDDIYVDLAFMEAVREYGVEVTPSKLSDVYSKTQYELKHGGQSGRCNLLIGKSPQRSGYWLDNPHADDNDFQTHADFIGLIHPGLAQRGSHLSNKVGHLMNYGDGYYGGLYVATLYSLAFTTNDLQTLVTEALRIIPERSKFHQCVALAIDLHRQYPYAWDRALGQFQKKWGPDFGCVDRLVGKEDADAKVNAAYLALALLYGAGDFEKTMQITKSIRRADCNVSTAAGILGVVHGFDKIPTAWKQGIDEIETQTFHNANISLADACDITMRLALDAIKNGHGQISKENVVIHKESLSPVKLERSFEGHYPKEVRDLGDTLLTDRIDYEFDGIGFVLRGEVQEEETADIFLAELYLNNKYVQVVEIPMSRLNRQPEIAWRFQLPHDHYLLSLRPLKKSSKHVVRLQNLVVYDVTPN